MKESKPKEESETGAMEELARRLLVMVRDSGQKRETDLRSAIAQKIQEAEISDEDQ